MNNKGFTLVEVLAVVAIIAILGLIAIPNVLKSIDIGKKASDEVLYNNIKVALQSMYEEIEYSGNTTIFEYNFNGKIVPDTNVSIVEVKDPVTNEIDYTCIITNIQTLVSNGFLSGINNEKYTANSNSKVVVNSEGEDIGNCVVEIQKKVNLTSLKVNYSFKGSSVNACPTDEDLG